MRPEWGTSEMPDSGGNPPTPEFTGAGSVYRLIGALFIRPRSGDWPRELVVRGTKLQWGDTFPRSERAERQGLSMVCLQQPDDSDSVITAIDSLLGRARPKQASPPHARVQGFAGAARGDGWSADDVEAVRDLLRVARNMLVTSSDNRGRRLRFPLFSLTYLLMDSTPDPDEPNPGGWRLRVFRQQGVMRRIETAVQTVDKEVVAGRFRWRIPLWGMYLLTLGVFRLALTGRIPGVSGRYGWFMRQPHLAPELSGTFVRFAGRLGAWRKEDPEYVARLLVNAFLEDLRRNYRLPWWHISGTRRMTYPVLLLDAVALTDGGDRLLWLVNEIRNQTGLFDPLLIVGGGRLLQPNPGRRAQDRLVPRAARDAAVAYDDWQLRLSESRRARRAITWYLPLEIPAPVTAMGPVPDPGMAGFTGFDLVTKGAQRTVRPPIRTNGAARLSVVILLLLVLSAFPVRYSWKHCGTWTFTTTVERDGDECIGISDGSLDLFQPSDEASRQVERVVEEQNRTAELKRRAAPHRPYITIAEVEATTSSDGNADGLTAERESLEGVATAQKQQLNKSGDTDPIVRVLLVDAGKNMDQAERAAQLLGDYASRDRSLVGVIGLDMSSTPTRHMIGALSRAGLPMVASTLSVASLAQGSPMYFQVAPTNSSEAQVVAAFAADFAAQHPDTAPAVRIYASDDRDDTYSQDLGADAVTAFRDAFGRKNFDITPDLEHFTPSRANGAGQSTCGYHGFVFFAGRGVPDYGDFLDGAAQCSSPAVFIGDDDVSRYVADAATRRANQALDFYYVSFAFAPPIKERSGAELDFYQDLDHLFAFETDARKARSLDGHAALAYDAAQVMIHAASYLRIGDEELPITPGTVWREITAIHDSPGPVSADHGRWIDGVSGTIDYGGEITSQVPKGKPVDIMRVVRGEVSGDIVGSCGNDANRHRTSAWCPPMDR